MKSGAEGRWIYDCAREEYTLDRNCARLLRLPDSVGAVCPARPSGTCWGPMPRFFQPFFPARERP